MIRKLDALILVESMANVGIRPLHRDLSGLLLNVLLGRLTLELDVELVSCSVSSSGN